MPKTFFAADTHLDPVTKPETWRVFLSFLDFVQRESGDLYILGDLFNYWSNHKYVEEKYRPLLEKLGELAKKRQVCLLFGNRDFLLRKSYLERWGINFLGQEHRLEIDKRQVFITHGDIFCAHDLVYQRFKKFGWPVLRFLDAITPGVIARKVALRMRRQSKKTAQAFSERSISETVLNEYFQSGVNLIICGHFHKALDKKISEDKQLIILPDWDSSSGGYCLISEGKVELLEFR